MNVWVVMRQWQAESTAQQARFQGNFGEVRSASRAAGTMSMRAREFALSKGGQVLNDEQYETVLSMPHTALEEFESIMHGYESSLNYRVAVGLGQDYHEAMKATNKSQAEGGFQFYHMDDEFYRHESEEQRKAALDQNEIADKTPRPEPSAEVAPSAEQEIQSREQYVSALAATQAEAMAPYVAQQMQAQADAAQQQDAEAEQQAQEQQAQAEAEGQAQQAADPNQPMPAEAAPGEEPDPRDAMMQGVIPEEQAAEPEEKSEDALQTEMDPAKAEKSAGIDFADPRYKIAGLLATVREHSSDLLRMRKEDPEGFAAIQKLVAAAIKLAKRESAEPGYLAKAQVDRPHLRKKVEEALEKALKKWKPTYPVGAVKDGRKKTVNPVTGEVHWRGMRSGQMLSDDGEPISTKTHNAIAEGNELGKDELEKDQPTLRFPKVKKLPTRPDQDVRVISTPRQKEIHARAAINDLVSRKDMSAQHADRMINSQRREVSNKRGGQHSYYLDPKKTKNQGRGRAWAHGIGKKVGSKDQAKKVDAKRQESVVQHEATHALMHTIGRQYGEHARTRLARHLVDTHLSPVADVMRLYLGQNGYARSKVLDEEAINHTRDILSNNQSRDKFVKWYANLAHDTIHGKGAPKTPESLERVAPAVMGQLSKMKSGWKNLTAAAKSMTHDDILRLTAGKV